MTKYGLSKVDFIKYKDYFFKMLDEIGLEKEEKVKSKNAIQRHDKSFKDILKNKKEMSKFLWQFLKIKIDSINLEEQKNSYINKYFERRESDILYKIIDKDVYILIEQQSKVDYRMPRRIFEYCMEIMLAIEGKDNNFLYKNPIILPIVIYTGENNWNVNTNFSDTQENYKEFQNYKINLNYKLIDINKYSKELLKRKGSKLAYMMSLEKCKTEEELKEEFVELILISKLKKDNNMLKWIKQQMKYVFPEMLGETKDKILKILENGEMNEMEDLIERIKANEEKRKIMLLEKGREKGRKEGKSEIINHIVRMMLQQNEDEEKIMQYTEIKKSKLNKIKKELYENTQNIYEN